MDGLNKYEGSSAGDKLSYTVDWLAKLSNWLQNQPALDALVKGLCLRSDRNVSTSGNAAVAGNATVTGNLAVTGTTQLTGVVTITDTPVLTGTASGTTACVFTANKGPTGTNTAIQGWIKITVSGTARYIPYW